MEGQSVVNSRWGNNNLFVKSATSNWTTSSFNATHNRDNSVGLSISAAQLAPVINCMYVKSKLQSCF